MACVFVCDAVVVLADLLDGIGHRDGVAILQVSKARPGAPSVNVIRFPVPAQVQKQRRTEPGVPNCLLITALIPAAAVVGIFLVNLAPMVVEAHGAALL